MRIKISVPTNALHSDLRQALHLAVQMGVRGVQFDLRTEIVGARLGESARRQLLYELKERDLEPASGHFPLKRPLIDPEHLDQRLTAIHDAITTASQLRIRRLTLRPGDLPTADSKERETLIQILGELAGAGDRHGVILCLLPGGDPASEWKPVLKAINQGLVNIDGDFSDWVLNGLPYLGELRDYFGVLGHVEGRDATQGSGGSGREVPIGRGTVDWDEVAALLNEMDYTGWINVQRTIGTDRIGDINRGVQYLKQLFLEGMI